MKRNLKVISENNELSYYTDEKNIQNQDLVQQTIEYFTTGEGARAFRPLEFLNLLEKQYQFVVSNITNGQKAISYLKALPLTELEKHVLFGLLLKWFGGYPVHNLNEDFDFTLKLIQKEFLSYEGDTPEKEFCKADFEQRKEFMKLGIAFTTAINNNLDAEQVYAAMGEPKTHEKVYNSFDELFKETAQNNLIKENESKQTYLIERSKYNYLFNAWLQGNKGWEYGNEDQYKTFLTKEVFKDFLKDYKAEEQTRIFLNNQTSNEAFQAFHNSYQRLRERFRVKRKATKEDCTLFPRLKEGDIIGYEPEYKTNSEAFALLKNYYAGVYLELEKNLFVDKYKVWNEATIKAEIQEIEMFINTANKESLSDASKAFNKWGIDKLEFIYLRLNSGFYEHLEIEYYPSISTIGNAEAQIYGRYFLFYNFLKKQLEALQPKLAQIKVNDQTISFEDLPTFLQSIGERVRPAKIEFNNDGTHKVTAWNIGKSIDELYNEKVEQIKKEVEGLEARCFSKSLDNTGLNLLAQQLKEFIYLYRHRNNVFENNPEQQKEIEEHFKAAANRLERLLNDVVLPKIEYRQIKIKAENEATNKPKQPFSPKPFSELFNKPDLVNDCINLLREMEKPCINEENEYQRDKGFFVIWFNALEYKKMFNYAFRNDTERAETLNLNFKNLNISESLFRYKNEKAKQYYNHFLSEISALKH